MIQNLECWKSICGPNFEDLPEHDLARQPPGGRTRPGNLRSEFHLIDQKSVGRVCQARPGALGGFYRAENWRYLSCQILTLSILYHGTLWTTLSHMRLLYNLSHVISAVKT